MMSACMAQSAVRALDMCSLTMTILMVLLYSIDIWFLWIFQIFSNVGGYNEKQVLLHDNLKRGFAITLANLGDPLLR